MNHIFLAVASAFGMFGVAIGAFGAHFLKDLLLKYGRLETFETAVKYHFYHALALLGIGILIKIVGPDKYLSWAGSLFAFGIVIFSGSLYLLSLTNTKWLGAITPIGGALFIAGWICLFCYSLK